MVVDIESIVMDFLVEVYVIKFIIIIGGVAGLIDIIIKCMVY